MSSQYRKPSRTGSLRIFVVTFPIALGSLMIRIKGVQRRIVCHFDVKLVANG